MLKWGLGIGDWGIKEQKQNKRDEKEENGGKDENNDENK